MNASVTSMRRLYPVSSAPAYGDSPRFHDDPVSGLPSFQQILESCACPVLIISNASHAQPIVYASPAFLKLSGYGPRIGVRNVLATLHRVGLAAYWKSELARGVC